MVGPVESSLRAGVLTATLVFFGATAPPSAGPAADVKIGILGGLSGPIESLVGPIVNAQKLAVTHVNAEGGLLGGQTLVTVIGDTGCADTTATANAADRLVNTENVVAIAGALCSDATISAANNVTVPGNVVMVSPASTSPPISGLDDQDLVFRVAPSDVYQGEVLARLLLAKGFAKIAIAHIDTDYGKGLADAIESTIAALGGTVALSLEHEDGKDDYGADVAALAAAGAPTLVIVAYGNGSGLILLRQAIESGAFKHFAGTDGMFSQTLVESLEADDIEGLIVTRIGEPNMPGLERYGSLAAAAGLDPAAPFVAQGYDSVFLLALAIEKNGTADRAGLSAALREVSSPPGEILYPGEWQRALEILKAGGDLNYEGASGSHDFDKNGDVPGSIIEMVVRNGAFVEVGEAH